MNIISNYNDLFETNSSLIFFDLETTGLNKNSDRIIEIGLIKVKNGKIVQTYSELLNPGIPVPYYATKVNGITNSMLRDKRSDTEGVKEILNLIDEDSIVIAHNISFDIGFINSYLQRMGNEPLKNRLVDTVKLSRKAFPGRRKYSLGVIASELGIDIKNAHRAEDDTRVCFELYNKSISKLKDRVCQ